MTGAPWQKRNRPLPEKIEFLLSNNTHLQRPKSARHWSDQDTEVDTDTPVVRHNRLEEVIFVYAAMCSSCSAVCTSAVLINAAPYRSHPKVRAYYATLVAGENLPDAN